jgi:Tol biopolymer transport system component
MNADGTDPVMLTPPETKDQSPTWSPDGTAIAFTRGTGPCRIMTIKPDGTGEKELATADVGQCFSHLDW